MDTCVVDDIAQKWHRKLRNYQRRNGCEKKHWTYGTFKNDFGAESYLTLNITFSSAIYMLWTAAFADLLHVMHAIIKCRLQRYLNLVRILDGGFR